MHALLSQVLVAYVIEFDNEFERRMREAGCPGARLSLVVWFRVVRFLGAGELTVRDLVERAPIPENEVRHHLGCLERWRIVVLDPGLDGARRDGWGSTVGIRSDSLVSLTKAGRAAAKTWPPLFEVMEQRWRSRFGDEEIDDLRGSLSDVLEQADFPLPWLLWRLLQAFAREFGRELRVPLKFCANTLRVLGESPIPLAEIPRLTGGSPETTANGWELKPYVIVEPDPAGKRGKVARLTPLGIKTQQAYHELVSEIEARWEERFGSVKMRRIRDCLKTMFLARSGERLLIAEGMVPAEGTVRAGHLTPALGRRNPGSAARQRMRDLVAQTERFIKDPVHALPYYPLWDMNRGFGP